MREPPVTRREFQKLAELRAEEAGVLVKNRRLQGAYYLAGYAVECALKARIARETKRHEFPPKPKHVHAVYTHNLSELLNLAELNQQLENEIKVNAALGINWESSRNGARTVGTSLLG